MHDDPATVARFAPMSFKGQKVYVLVDAQGAPVVRNGRATMRYRPDDQREYHPSVRNLAPLERTGHRPPKKSVPTDPLPAGTATNAVVAYTDGGCIGNPGPAGLGYVIRFPDGHTIAAGEPMGDQTNNIAELSAILRVLELLEKQRPPVVIHTDSTYAIGVLTQGWKARANQRLIADIKALMARFPSVELRKVKGHAGHPDNERVDRLANQAARTQQPIRDDA